MMRILLFAVDSSYAGWLASNLFTCTILELVNKANVIERRVSVVDLCEMFASCRTVYDR